MRKRHRMPAALIGSPPATLIEPHEAVAPVVTQYRISAESFSEVTVDATHLTLERERGIVWLDVIGLLDTDLVQQLGDQLAFHPLLLEDVLSIGHRPKIDYDDKSVAVSLRSLAWDPATKRLVSEQITLWATATTIVSWQERLPSCFDVIANRLRKPDSRMRQQGTAYLLYNLIDSLVDQHFATLAGLDDYVEALEARILQEPTSELVSEIHQLKQTLIFLRQSVWPLREIVHILAQDSPLVGKGLNLYWRDVSDHVTQLIDLLELLRDVGSGLLDLYLSSVSQRTNDVMRLLTVIATIFMPLTFITSLYGMNFQHMPELAWRWGYLAVWGVLATVSVGLVWYFHRRRWL